MGFLKQSLPKLVATSSLAITLLIASSLPAQDTLQLDTQPSGSAAKLDATEPVLVVTIGSINKLMQDVNYVTGAVGQPQAGGMFSMMASMFTRGIDTTQPIGILVPLVNGAPQPIAVVPTKDVKQVLKSLEAQTGPADELSDGKTLVIALGANMVYIRQVGDWAVLAPSSELLELAPADPTTLFEGMGNDYLIAVRLKMQQVPAETRGILTAQLRQGFEQAMAKQNNDDAEAGREVAEATLKQLDQFINETDMLKFGINVDQAGKQIVMDGSFTAVPGTQLASVYSGTQAIPSQFASVIREDAAAFYHAATSISAEAVEQTRSSMKTTLSAVENAIANEDKLNDVQRAEISAMIDRVADLGLRTVAEGRADIGALLLADQQQFQFVFGAFVADGNEAAQIVKDLAAKIENEPGAPTFLFDQSTYKDVTMHVVEADVPESEDEARRVFGDKLRVHIGTAPKAVYAAVGKNSEAAMKELIDAGGADTGANRPVGQLRLKLMPILQFAQSVEANDALAAMIDSLSRASDPGLLTVTQKSIPFGQESHITIGEGMLQAIGAAIQQAQQAKMQQQGQF